MKGGRADFSSGRSGSARFEIWNKDQEVVVSIGETKDGAGEIFVASADGKPRAGLKVHELGGIVSAQNSAGQTNVLMLGKDQGGTFVVADAEGRPVAEITTVDGDGVVSIKGKTGYQMAYMGCDENRGLIAVLGKRGRTGSSVHQRRKRRNAGVFRLKRRTRKAACRSKALVGGCSVPASHGGKHRDDGPSRAKDADQSEENGFGKESRLV